MIRLDNSAVYALLVSSDYDPRPPKFLWIFSDLPAKLEVYERFRCRSERCMFAAT